MAGFTQFIPIVLLIAFLGIFAWIGYQMYLYSQVISTQARQKLEKRNISYSKDGGMKVGVKEMSSEEYSSKTQSVLVDAWNKSEWPDYKSRLWNKEAQTKGKSSGSSPKTPASKSGSSKS